MRSEFNKYVTFRNLLLTGSAASALTLGLAPAAMAQGGPVEKVTVTGTRIPQKNLITTSPVTQLSAADVDVQGVTRIEDLTNQLPQVFAGQGANVSNGASGTATINLRGLGSQRTLVLINGRRMGYGDFNTSASDLNQIPEQLVERIEVLTGGASAVYGSDAVGGVVNFIMRKNFEGVQIDAQYGWYEHHNDSDNGNIRSVIAARAVGNPFEFQLPPDDVNDGFSKSINGTMGVSSDQGNITLFAGYRVNDLILQRDRDFSECALAGGGPVSWACGGSGTSATGRFTSGAGVLTIDRGTGLARAAVATDAFNYGPTNYYQRPDERYTFGAFSHYQIDEQVELFGELMFTNYNSQSQIAPSGNFGNTSSINCGNPYLNGTALGGAVGSLAFSVAQLTAMGCDAAAIAANTSVFFITQRRNVEGGGRQDNIHMETYRMTGGARGEIISGWDYDLALQYSRSAKDRDYRNDMSVSRLGRALNVIDNPATIPVDPTCQSVIDGTDPFCVPYNVFQNGGVTQAALNYLQIPLLQKGYATQSLATLAINGDLGTMGFVSPWATSSMLTVFGAEMRRDAIVNIVDTSFQTGDGAGQGGPTLPLEAGSIDITEYFGELEIPLIEDQPFFKQVKIDLAYRYSHYDTGLTTDTYKMGLDWSPTEDIRFRASQQRAVRAPNIIELFSASGTGLFDMADDPCDLTDPAADGVGIAAVCQGVLAYQLTPAQAAGIPAPVTSPAGQYNGFFGGNPSLGPETADTMTLGFVFTPTFMDGFQLSVDYFDIEITDLVSTVGATNTVNACYLSGDLTSCGLIIRNPATGDLYLGTVAQVRDLTTNIGGLQTSGVDFNATYRFDLDDVDMSGSGAMRFELIATWMRELITDPGFPVVPVEPYDCAGFFSGVCGTPNPEWRHRFRTTWQTPWDADLSVTWRRFGSVDLASSPPVAPVTGRLDSVFEAEDYFDVHVSVDLPLNMNLRLGMNNVLDNDPPISSLVGAGFGNGNTFPQVYDAQGRWVFMGLTVDM